MLKADGRKVNREWCLSVVANGGSPGWKIPLDPTFAKGESKAWGGW